MKKTFFSWCVISIMILTSSLSAVCQVKEEFDDLIFYIPNGLSITKTENSLSLRDSLLANDQNFSITINKSVISLKKIEKSFPVFWRESLMNEGVDNPVAEPEFVKAQTTSGWSCFRGGKMVTYNDKVPSFYYHLIILRYMGITVKIITHASSEELFFQKYPQLMQMVSAINFKSTPKQTTQPGVSSNQNQQQ
jgi:hypothetical protein